MQARQHGLRLLLRERWRAQLRRSWLRVRHKPAGQHLLRRLRHLHQHLLPRRAAADASTAACTASRSAACSTHAAGAATARAARAARAARRKRVEFERYHHCRRGHPGRHLPPIRARPAAARCRASEEAGRHAGAAARLPGQDRVRRVRVQLIGPLCRAEPADLRVRRRRRRERRAAGVQGQQQHGRVRHLHGEVQGGRHPQGTAAATTTAPAHHS